jgi:hypothetical protein
MNVQFVRVGVLLYQFAIPHRLFPMNVQLVTLGLLCSLTIPALLLQLPEFALKVQLLTVELL